MTTKLMRTAPAHSRHPEGRHGLPSAYPSLKVSRTARLARRIAVALLVLLVLSSIAFLFVPWQQTAVGKGFVVAFDSNQRHQLIDAPISGRIVEWDPQLVEGTHVNRGDRLFDIEVVDSEVRRQLAFQIAATERKLEFERKIVDAYFQNASANREIKIQIIEAGIEFIKAAEQKLQAEHEGLKAALAAADQSERDRVRRKEMFEKKVGSEFDWERAVRQAEEANAKVAQSRSYIKVAENELAAKKAELEAKGREAQTKVESAQASYEKSRGDLSATEKEIAALREKQTMQRQSVLAPNDGYIVKVKVSAGGPIVSQGETLLELVPSSPDRAVAIKIDGNDAPLVATKSKDGQPRKVRLQFEGWPAVQFSGWPSAAVGTFGGIVSVVDAIDDGQGKFRVLIVPDPSQPPWPSEQLLRQGVRANAWVLLDQVPLGWELWRQMNAFPPAVETSGTEKSSEKLLRAKK